MNRLFLTLSFLMGVVVLASNYLVQFPIKYYGLEKILTYGAFSYPIAFLITDLANRSFGKVVARRIVYVGFVEKKSVNTIPITKPTYTILLATTLPYDLLAKSVIKNAIG